jgi:hypothetical protein
MATTSAPAAPPEVEERIPRAFLQSIGPIRADPVHGDGQSRLADPAHQHVDIQALRIGDGVVIGSPVINADDTGAGGHAATLMQSPGENEVTVSPLSHPQVTKKLPIASVMVATKHRLFTSGSSDARYTLFGMPPIVSERDKVGNTRATPPIGHPITPLVKAVRLNLTTDHYAATFASMQCKPIADIWATDALWMESMQKSATSGQYTKEFSLYFVAGFVAANTHYDHKGFVLPNMWHVSFTIMLHVSLISESCCCRLFSSEFRQKTSLLRLLTSH